MVGSRRRGRSRDVVRTASKGAALIATALTLLGLAVVAATADAKSPQASELHVGYSHKGLGHDVPIPQWAQGRFVHFYPTESNAPGRPGQALGHGPSSSSEPQNYLGMRCNFAECADPPLLYHYSSPGTQHNIHLYPIFWGSNWNSSGASLRTKLLQFYNGLSGSAYQGILTQYFDSTANISKTVSVTPYTDTTVGPAPKNITNGTIQEEIGVAIEVHPEWSLDQDSQFVVLAAPGSTYGEIDAGITWCAYHGTHYGKVVTPFGFVPDEGESPFSKNCLYGESGDNATSAAAAHEYAEAATDPIAGTWETEEGWEIADMCTTGGDELPNGSIAEGLWDDHQAACSLSDPEPPQVYAVTNTPKNVTAHAATLQGTVNPEGRETHYSFEYGPTKAYGTTVVVPGSASGRGANVKVAEAVGGLELEGTYHYRISATNSSGTTYGEDESFKTTEWKQQETSLNYPGPKSMSVSCPSKTNCMSVGEYFADRPYPWARRWDGVSWLFVPGGELPPSGVEGALEAVSCSSPTACMAVGWWKNQFESESNSGGQGLSERWDGSEWTVVTGAGLDPLYGVSCTSSTACVAVGGWDAYRTSGSSGTRARLWDGTKWTALTTVNPSGKYQRAWLNSVSCTSTSACEAVGGYSEGYNEPGGGPGTLKTLAERWNGTKWTLESSPNAPGKPQSSFEDVSCGSTSDCIAVGWGGDEATEGNHAAYSGIGIASHWNSAEWTSTSIESGALQGVSCPSATSCVAVGQEHNGTMDGRKWDGAKWSLTKPGVPAYGNLEAVSCLGSIVCTAVGVKKWGELVERLPGPPPQATTSGATSVSQTAATLAGIVNPKGSETTYRFEYGETTAYGKTVPASEPSAGSGESDVEVNQGISGLAAATIYHFRIVATNEGGTTYGEDQKFGTCKNPECAWSLQTTANPQPKTESQLNGVSCPSASTCLAAGKDNYTGKGLVELWNGSEWKVLNSTGRELNAIACASTTSCISVGANSNGEPSSSSITELGGGFGWVVGAASKLPTPEGGSSVELKDVSCTATSACTAVGSYNNGTRRVSLAERWNGEKWAIQTTANSETGTVELLGVSCDSSSSCTAVGKHESEAFAERWNGTSWSISATSKPTGATWSALEKVSCTSASNCMAVGAFKEGSSGESSNKKTLAERWNGSSWSVASSPNPSGAKGSSLLGVSCTSTSACTAVGRYVSAATGGLEVFATEEKTLAESWNGSTWAIQASPNPEGQKFSLLNGVSCSTSTACTAVGSAALTAGVEKATLGERYE
jgi:hypothetical protein